jgi:sugar/nucleoside kinase (ribokinase family)
MRKLNDRGGPGDRLAGAPGPKADDMTEKKPRLVAVGEVMIELTRAADGRYRFAFGGDTFNTSVYLARGGLDVDYATALGDDPYSEALLALASPGVCRDSIWSRPMTAASVAFATGATPPRPASSSSSPNGGGLLNACSRRK